MSSNETKMRLYEAFYNSMLGANQVHYNNSRVVHNFRDLLGKLGVNRDEYLHAVKSVTDAVMKMDYDQSVLSSFGPTFYASDEFIRATMRMIYRKDVDSEKSLPTAAITLNSGLSNQMTASQRRSIADTLKLLIDKNINVVYKSLEREDDYYPTSKITENMAGIFMFVNAGIARSVLRSSTHRPGPYNTTSFIIQAFKFWKFIKYLGKVGYKGKKITYEEITKLWADSKISEDSVRMFILTRPYIEERKDHMILLRSPLPNSLTKVARSLHNLLVISNYARRTFNRSNIGLNDRDLILKVVQDNSTFNDMIMSRVRSGIFTVDLHFVNTVNKNRFLSQNDMTYMIDHEKLKDSIVGKWLSFSHIISKPELKSAFEDILKIHSMSKMIPDLAHPFDVLQDHNELYPYYTCRENNTTYMFRRYTSVTYAKNSWFIANRDPLTTAYLVKSGIYHILISIGSEFPYDENNRYTSWGDIVEMSESDCIMISHEISEINSEVTNLINTLQASNRDTSISDSAASMSFTAAIGGRTTIINDSPFVAALGQASSGAYDMKMSLPIYLSVRAWMRCNKDNIENEVEEKLKDEILKFLYHVRSNNGKVSAIISNDISQTWQWVIQSGFTPSHTIDLEMIMKHTNTIMRLDEMFNVPVTLTASKPQTYENVKYRTLDGLEPDLGETYGYLYEGTDVVDPNDTEFFAKWLSVANEIGSNNYIDYKESDSDHEAE